MRSRFFFRTFVFCGFFFGLFQAAASLFEGKTVAAATIVGIITGSFFGLMMAVTMTPFLARQLRRRGFDLDGELPDVDARETVAVPLPPDAALERCRAALDQLRVRTVRTDPASAMVRGRVPMTWATWGERIECRVHPAEQGSRVEIRSRPVLRTTLVDFGRNRENVERVSALLAQAR
jgi:hypothetical protein